MRAGDVADDVLINDALSQAASLAANQISLQTLPSGTVLNTGTSTALVNSGSRSGFKEGMHVIITRGRQQVGSGEVIEVQPDKSTIKITRQDLGFTPGDKVRAIFDVPDIAPGFDPSGNAIVVRP